MDKVIRYITHDEECWLCGGTGELLVGLDDAATCYDCDGKGIVAGTWPGPACQASPTSISSNRAWNKIWTFSRDNRVP